MADKNIQMKKKKSDGTFDDYFPITKNENVIGGRVVTGSIAVSGTPFSRTINLGFRPKYVKVYWSVAGDERIEILEQIDGAPSTILHSSTGTHMGSMDTNMRITMTSTGFTVKGSAFESTPLSYIAIG